MKKNNLILEAKEKEIVSLKKKIAFLEKEISILNENILDSTNINEQVIKLIENLTTEILELKKKAKINNQNEQSIFNWIQNQNKLIDFSIKNINNISKSVNKLEEKNKKNEMYLWSKESINSLKKTIKGLADNDEKTAKSISDINKTLYLLSQNDGKIAEAIFDMSKRIDNYSDSNIADIFDTGNFDDVKTLVVVRKNYLIFNIQKYLKRFAYEAIIDYLNSSVNIKNIYFFFNLGDEKENKQEFDRFEKYYLKRIKDKFVELMYE